MNNEKGKNITKKSSKDDLSLQSQEERIKKNTPKNNKRKKIAVATTATVLIATAIAVPTVIYLSRRKFDVNVLTNTDIVEEYTINVKKGVYIQDLTAQQIEGYTFVGFYKDAKLTQPYGKNDRVRGDMQIYAKYEINIYSLKFPTSPAFTIEGEAIEGNQVNIEYNTEYQFKINLNAGYTESEITVKANGEIIEADSNGYYTLTVKDDIVIEVEGVAINTYTITFYDETGETIYKIEEVEYNQDSTYKEIPTKHSTPTYNYTFAGWVDREGKPVDLTNIIVDKDVYASFTEEYIEYRINKIPSQVVIKDSEGIELTGSNTLHYGDIVEITYNVTEGHNVVDFSVNGAERIEDTNTYKITGDLTVTYSEEIQTFDVTISVNNPEYGTVNITNISVDYGTEIIETFDELKIGEFTIKATPTDDNPTYNYSFVNWTNAVSEVKEDLTITANFVRTMDEYIVSIIVNNADYGSVSQPSLVVNYNTPIVIEGNKLIIDGQEIYAEPKDNTAQYSYEFIDWSNATDVITGNREIIANFNRTTNSYTVTFYDENKTTILDTLKDEYGTIIVYSAEEPTKSADNTYIYTFECWETADGEEYDLSGKTITSDLVLYARYRATYIEYDISEIPLQVEIRKDDLELSSNDKLHYGDRIEITYTATTGYMMTEFSVTGATREGETNFYTVTGDLTIIYEEDYIDYTISDIPTQITIKRNNIEITTDDVLHYGDRLEIIYNETVGYEMTKFEVTGATREGETNFYTVTGNLTVIYEEDYIDYTISDIPTQITIKRNNIILTTEDVIHYGDVIEITYNVTEGYEFENLTVTGADQIDNTNQYIVTGNLTINYSEQIKTFEITIAVNNSEYGKLNIYSVTVPYGTTYTTSGNILTFSNDTEIIATASNNTAQYTYTFANWSSDSGTVTAEATIIANFNRVTNSYTVTFYDENKITVLDTLTDEYGTSIVYSGEEPTKSVDNTYTYTFECWETADGEEYDLSGKTITSDLVLYARYRATYIEYDISEIPAQVEIRKGGEELTSSDTIHYGDRIEITYTATTGYMMTEFSVMGATREGETNFYTVTGDLTVIYSEEIQTFAVTIEVNNAEYGSLNIYSVTVPYGTTYVAEGNTLTFSDNTKVIAEKFEDTAQYTYTFTGWSSDSGTVTAEATIIASFNRVTNSYTVTFYDENKITVLDTLTDEYGTSIVYSGANPTKPADNTYAYTFECWGTADGEEYDLSGKTITSDLALYARYRATYIEYDISEIPLQVEIRKDDLELSSNDKLHYGDRIEITYTVTTGYNMTEFSVTGATREGETNIYTVTGDLTVIYSEEIQTFAVTIEVNNAEYGSLNTYSVTVPYGTTYTTSDNILTFSNDTEIIATASTNTAQYTYTFTGWSSDSGTITAEEIITANFNRVTNSYTVTFYDENRTTVLDTLTDEYGTSIVYSGANPTKPVDNTYTYTFECWETVDGEEYDLSGKTITSDLALYARYRATYIEYDISEIPAQVEIRKGGEELTSSDTIHYGDRIEITYTATTGYMMTEFSVTGATREGETNIYTVTGDLTVIYSEEIQTFAVTIEVNNAEYGSLNIYSVTVPYGTTYVAEGNTLTFSDNTKVIAEKFEDTAQYTYTFTGWSSDSGTITAEEIITANFNRVTNSYTVTFYDENRTTVLDTLTDEYGTSIVYSGANPTKPADNTYAYTFECWETAEGEEYDLSGKTITSDLALYARYRATYIEYEIANIPEQVEIKKGEQVLTSEDTLHYGDRIEITYTVTTGYNMTEFSVTGATRDGETNFYTVTGDLTVIYEEEIQTFTVQWLNYDGTLLETDTVAYGSIPEYNGEIPVRESTDDEYVYTFTGWDPKTNEAKENISYTAQFRQDEILYFTITRGMITGYTGTDTEVIIPNSYSISPDGRIITGDDHNVTSIGEAAFQNNSNITSITIPANVTSIGDDAFEGCTGLTEINYNATNLADLSMFNSVFSKAGQDGAGIVLNIGANVRRIPAYLFKTSIYKPNIVAVNFAENSQCTEIGEHAFYYCTSFSSITIPASIISIGNNAFSLSSNLENVYYEGTIEEWMKISFDSYGANPLNNSTNLYVNGDELVTEVNFDSSYTIKAYVFYGCTSITKVTIGSQVTSIRNWAFRGCRNLENVYYEGTIEEWMKISFDDYSNPLYNGANLYVNGDELVTEVSIDSSSTIKNNVFSGCKSLTKVTIGSQVTNIGEYAFYNCSNLTSITIPANVTNIGSHAFYGCTGLIEINYNATNLADLSFDSSIFYDAGQDGAGIVVNIGANVRRIPAYLFDDSNNITTVNFAENSRCIEVGESAFSGYGYGNIVNVYYGGTIEEWMKISFDDVLANPLNEGNLYVNGDELVTEVSINSSSRIKDYVFQGCASITKVTIGNQVTSIGEWAFSGCSNLTNVYYEGTIEEWMEISFDGSSSNPLTNGANLYVNGDELVTEVSIDSSSTIKDYVFQGCTSLTKVTIGSQVTSIGSSAFSGCSGLTSITIPENITSIGNRAFYGCTGLIEINYNATNLADLSRNNYVFRNAGEDGVGIVVNIGANVRRIPEYLFDDSDYITTVNFAENSQCTEIGEYAFRYCGSLTSITIPANVTSIGSGAFSLTSDLETVIIESNYVYKTATSTTACGNLLRYATVVRVLTSCIGEDTNSYLENSANFTKSIDGEYTVYTKV